LAAPTSEDAAKTPSGVVAFPALAVFALAEEEEAEEEEEEEEEDL
jgi:hypothetical protein